MEADRRITVEVGILEVGAGALRHRHARGIGSLIELAAELVGRAGGRAGIAEDDFNRVVGGRDGDGNEVERVGLEAALCRGFGEIINIPTDVVEPARTGAIEIGCGAGIVHGAVRAAVRQQHCLIAMNDAVARTAVARLIAKQRALVFVE